MRKMYYIFKFSTSKVKLCLSKYQVEQFEPEFVNITSASAGTLSPINPLTNLTKNNTVRFVFIQIHHWSSFVW